MAVVVCAVVFNLNLASGAVAVRVSYIATAFCAFRVDSVSVSSSNICYLGRTYSNTKKRSNPTINS